MLMTIGMMTDSTLLQANSAERGMTMAAKDNIENVKAGIEFWDEIPPDQKLFIVFKGTPMIEAASSLNYAQQVAEEMCPEPGDEATIMLISKHSLTHALKAVNHGVVIHSLNDDNE